MENKLTENVFREIKEKNIKPKSKWQFILKDYIVWFVFFLSIILGSVSFAVILYLMKINDWGAYTVVTSDFTTFVFMSLPYFWLIVFPIFLWISYHYLVHTKKGYRFEFAKIVALNLGFSIFLGSILFLTGIGKMAENTFVEKSPFYRDMMIERGRMWHKPEKGAVAGRISTVLDENTFELAGLREDEIWVIYYQDAEIFEEVVIEEGVMVKVFGDGDPDSFIAKEIRVFIGGGRELPPPIPGLTEEVMEVVK